MKDTTIIENLPVEKIVELIGISHNGWEEAAAIAVKEAAKTVRNIKEVDVKRFTAKVEKDTIVEYRAIIKITFKVEREI
ncbi:MAG: dodecin family protein [Methanomicrobiales archaeon]|nr:dodecin family protein [Methanomicrobiales archaeon]